MLRQSLLPTFHVQHQRTTLPQQAHGTSNDENIWLLRHASPRSVQD